MKPRLNLATAPLANHRRFLAGSILAGVAAASLFAVLSVRTFRDWRENRDLREDTTRLESDMRGYAEERRELEEFFRKPENKRAMERAEFLNSIIRQRSFPWTRVFMDLERQLPTGVRVVSIAPRMDNGRVEVKLVVGAADDAGKLKFLKALEASPEFTRVQVTGESRPRTEEGDNVVLELVVWYAADLAVAKGAN